MTNIARYFDSAEDTLTITLTSLANATGASSSAIDNSTDKFIGADLKVKTKGASGSNTGLLEIYLLGSNDNSDFADTANGKLVGSVLLNGTTSVIKTIRILELPKHFKIYALNNSGDALSATAGDHEMKLLGNTFTDA